MFSKAFFASQVWRGALANFAKSKDIAAPVVKFTLIDGSSFYVKNLRAFSHLVQLEVYGEEEETTVRFVPYDTIRHVELQVKEPEEKRPLEFELRVAKRIKLW